LERLNPPAGVKPDIEIAQVAELPAARLGNDPHHACCAPIVFIGDALYSPYRGGGKRQESCLIASTRESASTVADRL
jgi:hypothetical protein